MKKKFTSFKDIKLELKRLDLERQIAWEEMKGLKDDVKYDLNPLNWQQTILNYISKVGFSMFIKKMFK